MLVAQLIGIGLLLHESVYISSRGISHWSDNLAPVGGLHVGARFSITIHSAFIIAVLVLIFFPQGVIAYLVSFTFLSMLIAIFPRRLPNHLILAWFFLLVFVAWSAVNGGRPHDGIRIPLTTIQVMTCCVYGLAGLHKLNKDFFDRHKSCGSGFVIHYLLQRGFPLKRYPVYAVPIGIYFVVLSELLLPVLLLVHPMMKVGLLLACLLSCAFGFLAHVHFSTMMLAGLIAYVPIANIQQLLFPAHMLWVPVALGVTVGLICGNYRPYRHRSLAMVNHAVFGIIVVATLLAIIPAQLNDKISHSFDGNPSIFTILIGLFVLNGLCPYLGIKQDFSFAMFSNLTACAWSHFLIRRPLVNLAPRYFQVHGLTRDANDVLLQEFEGQFKDRTNSVFSLPYVIDAVAKMDNSNGRGLPIAVWVSEYDSGSAAHSSSLLSRRGWREHISVFPYCLPIDHSLPLLS